MIKSSYQKKFKLVDDRSSQSFFFMYLYNIQKVSTVNVHHFGNLILKLNLEVGTQLQPLRSLMLRQQNCIFPDDRLSWIHKYNTLCQAVIKYKCWLQLEWVTKSILSLAQTESKYHVPSEDLKFNNTIF